MWSDIGFYLLFLCCILSIYGFIAALVAARLRHRRLYQSAKFASTATMFLSLLASFLLWVLLFNRDYSLSYIYKNSSNDLPLRYTLSAFWSALEGSHFLWALLMAIYSTIAHWTNDIKNEHIMPYVSATLQAILAWMFYLAITYSDPFAPFFPMPTNGLGMNALLQNPYMVIHPPSLFTGYTALAVPFAYSMGALAYGDITEGWLRSIRRWTLYAWAFLTLGIFLGGRWAYVELGWAGYWAWDPVENSSFLPWLFSTALLHSLVVQEKLGQLKRLSVILSALAFYFSFFGTFITRSGVISSVHSFAQSPIGPNYLFFLSVLLGAIVVIYAWRAPSILPGNTQSAFGFSKESFLLVTQFLLLSFAIIVLVGTIYPIISEAITGARFNVQAPYYNAFAPFLGFAFVIAISFGNLMRYRTQKLTGGVKVQIWSGLFAVLMSYVFGSFGDVWLSKGSSFWFQLIGIWLSFWALGCLLYDAWMRLKDGQFRIGFVLQRNLSYFGALLAHIGVLAAVLGFLGNFRGLDKTFTLNPGEKVSFYGFDFTFEGLQVLQNENVVLYNAPIQVHRRGHEYAHITPARAKYPTSSELFHEVGLESRFWNDLYIILSDFDSESFKHATLEIHINPTVRLVWWSCLLMVLGGLLSFFDKRRGQRSKDVWLKVGSDS